MMRKLFFAITCLIAIGMAQPLKAQNYSVQFDGVNDYIDIGSAANGVRTIEMWFNPGVNITSTLSSAILLMGRDVTTIGNYGRFYLGFSASAGHQGELMFYFKHVGATGVTYSGINNWTAGTWYHVTVVIDPTTGTQIYVNGTAAGSSSSTETTALGTKTEITAIGRYGATSSNYFSGRIENVRLWTSALTNPLLTYYQCNTISTTLGLNAEYLLNDGGTTALDQTGTYNGTLIGGPTYVIDCPCDIVMQFDGTDDYVDIGTVGNGLRSMEMWFKPRNNINVGNATATYTSLIVRDDATQWEEYGLYFSPTGSGSTAQIIFFARNAGAPAVTVASGFANWVANTWYHVTATIGDPLSTNPGMRLYVNGILVGGPNLARTIPIAVRPEITALASWGAANLRFFEGQMENVRLWSRVLVQSGGVDEPAYHMCNVPVNYASIITEYRFNEHHDDILSDQFNVTANDGTVYGGATNALWVEGNPCNIGAGFDRNVTAVRVNQTQLESGINVYPNPNSGSFIVETGDLNGNAKIEIYDMTGKLVRLLKGNSGAKTEFDLSQEPKGIYIVKISDGEKVNTKKILIE